MMVVSFTSCSGAEISALAELFFNFLEIRFPRARKDDKMSPCFRPSNPRSDAVLCVMSSFSDRVSPNEKKTKFR